MVVEDLYRPYRPKRRTRATIAKEKGLEPLANILRLQTTDKSLEEEARAFVSEEKEVKLPRKLWQGLWTLWLRVFPMRQTTGSGSVR